MMILSNLKTLLEAVESPTTPGSLRHSRGSESVAWAPGAREETVV